MKTLSIAFVLIVVLTGLSAGLGFGNAVGYMPAMKDTPSNHLVSFWQHADHYFRARMPVFGNSLLVALLFALFLLRKEWQSSAFLLIALAFVVCVADLIVILTQNLPVNEIIQSIDPEHPLAIDFEPLRAKAMRAYYLRAFFNMLSFALVVAGVAVYLRSHLKWIDTTVE